MSDSDSDQELLLTSSVTKVHHPRTTSNSPTNNSKLNQCSSWCSLTTLVLFISIYILTQNQQNSPTSLFTASSEQPLMPPPVSLSVPSRLAPSPKFDSRYRPQQRKLPQSENSTTFFQHSKDPEPFSLKTPRGDYRKRALCKILKNTKCQSNFIADVIDLFWVIAPIYSFDTENDWQYFVKHEEFKSCMKSYGLKFLTIEAIRYPENRNTFELREPTDYAATVPGNEPYDIQVYYYNMSYIRENLLNVAVRKLDKQAPWEYMAWIDGHQYFMNLYWWEEAIYKAEKYASVHLFETVNYLNPLNLTQFKNQDSVIHMSLLVNELGMDKVAFGNAHALSKEMYKGIGSIYDECIATNCDCAYILGSMPDKVKWLRQDWATGYYKNFEPWVNNTKKVFQGRRAFIRGHLRHFYHGGRFPYYELAIAAQRFGFNASIDIKRDQNFSIYIDNQVVTPVLEWIIFEEKKKSSQSKNKVIV